MKSQVRSLEEAKKQAWGILEPAVMSDWAEVGARPALWWELASPEPRDKTVSQVEQLDAMGELSESELDELESAARAEDAKLSDDQYSPFRRSRSWWRFISLERRDSNVTEFEQLQRLDKLSPIEQKIVAAPVGAQNGRFGKIRSLHHLRPEEKKMLKLIC